MSLQTENTILSLEFPREEDNEHLSDSDSSPQREKVDVHKPIAEPLFELPCDCELPDCAICLDPIAMVNVTVTTCGHTFHSSCVFKSLKANDNCPLCRHELVEPLEDDDEFEEIDDDDDDNETATTGDDNETATTEDDGVKVNAEQLANKLTHMGFTLADIIKVLVVDIKSANEEKYTEDYCDHLSMTLDQIMDGSIPLSQRDNRSYVEVAKSMIDESKQISSVPKSFRCI